MSKGTIRINKTKKGFEVKCDLANGRPPLVLVGFGVEEDMEGKECELELVNGQPVRVTIGEKEYRKQQAQLPQRQTQPQQGFSRNRKGAFQSGPAAVDRAIQDHAAAHPDNARAPYNFIPLNESPVSFPEDPAKSQDLWREDCFSGHISLEIEAKTPLYIRGTSADPSVQSDFFGPGGILRIPGSSLRGMIRNLVQIASFGGYGEEHTNVRKRLYYRGVGDMTELGNSYRHDMIDVTNNYLPKVKAGILRRESRRLILYPSDVNMGTQIYRINGSFNANDQFTVAGTGVVISEYKFSKIYFQPVTPSNHTHYRRDRQGNQIGYQLKYALVTIVSETPSLGLVEGYLICSGRFGAKKHMQWIINAPTTTGIPIPEAVEADYRDDSNREDDADLLTMLNRYQEIPCFYITESNNPNSIRAIGHTGLFRLPYKETIGDHIPSALKQTGLVDCAGAVFGILEKWAGRVSFEDAPLVDGQVMEAISPKILSGPKPTTFQHYLEPSNGTPQHWDTSANLRGYKLYWHRKTPENGPFAWREEAIKRDTQHTVIQPVRAGARFVGRIRFDNLTKEELGAILFVLKLPSGCHHKLGMGKPLGLGSVAITPTLHLTNRKNRYKELFSGERWSLAESSAQIATYTDVFEAFMLAGMSPGDRNGAASLWNTPRMRELKAMLDWDKADTGGNTWLDKTRYMEIDRKEFRGRPVLKPPSRI